jgi:hypothetical protein
VALVMNDNATAEPALKSARDIDPLDPEILTLLALAEYRNHHYDDAISTVRRLHAGEHKQFAAAHVVAAAAWQAEGKLDGVEAEYRVFLQEDPTNASAADARRALTQIEENRQRAQHDPDPPEQTEDGAVVLAEPHTHGRECLDCAPPRPVRNALASAARPATGAADTRSGWVFKADVDEVRVLFTADDDGHPVTDLTRQDIAVADDQKAARDIVDFRREANLPLRIGLLIDTSNSLHDRFEFEKRAATRFLASVMVGRADAGFAGGFANHVRIIQDFTGDVDRLAQGILRLRLGGGTSVWDAIYLGCDKLASGERDLYIVSTNMLPRKSQADRALQGVALETGGEAMFPPGLSRLDHAFAKLRDTIRSRYSIAYRPAAFARDGRYRTISIEAHRGAKKLNVHARKGYWARTGGSEN